jgi:5-methylcytosine-specific restriction endonuclease McrA
VEGKCAICGREETLTRHHLIPRTRHHNKRNKREFERATVRQIVGICRSCHSQIHSLLSEKELEREYNSVEKLKAHPGVAKFAEWIATKPRGFKAAVQRSGSRTRLSKSGLMT